MLDLPETSLTPPVPRHAEGKILRRLLVQVEREAAATGSGR